MLITGIYAAVAALFFIFLSFRVIGHRRNEKISVGDGGNAELQRAMRVHANFAEYTPIALILLAVVEMNGLAEIAVHGFGAIFLLARLLHFIGFSSEASPIICRQIGMLLTFLVIALLALTALWHAFQGPFVTA